MMTDALSVAACGAARGVAGEMAYNSACRYRASLVAL